MLANKLNRLLILSNHNNRLLYTSAVRCINEQAIAGSESPSVDARNPTADHDTDSVSASVVHNSGIVSGLYTMHLMMYTIH